MKSSSEEVGFCLGFKLGQTWSERAFQREGAAMEKAVSLQVWSLVLDGGDGRLAWGELRLSVGV